MATLFGTGKSTQATACCLRVNAGRISQLGRQFMRDWLTFHGELLERAI